MSAPGWRNWQTRETQNLVIARSWGFDSLSGHIYSDLYNRLFSFRIVLDDTSER